MSGVGPFLSTEQEKGTLHEPNKLRDGYFRGLAPAMPNSTTPARPPAEHLLERAVRIAAKVHKGQVDRFGHPFLMHVMRVTTHGKDVDEQILGALHDVLERSDITVADLREKGFPDHVLVALTHISRVPDEDYDGYIDRVALNSLAVRVKVHDLADKMDLREVGTLSVADLKRYNKQLEAYERLKRMATMILAEMTLASRPKKAGA